MTVGDLPEVRSETCGLEELFSAHIASDRSLRPLAMGSQWPRRWSATWRTSAGELVCPARDLAAVPVLECVPVRRFSWRASQRHRPGLEFMVSTGRLHGFESLEEQRLLLALDFAGSVAEVLPQPFQLRFETGDGFREHVPDFLAVLRDGSGWLFDVRPAPLIRDRDEVAFAAAQEAAWAVGWRYSVVEGWRPHVMSHAGAAANGQGHRTGGSGEAGSTTSRTGPDE
ncbi:TnsA-like heteromeric transposase endonuclease subunit [Nonomuraea aurantiaca]|uniref:TnsA-like heteromeric transposase endonuclease subunit n=1 Tax=Nonomuraea aurantiaca TaxID=2878562 RepID=UPI001CDA4C57|nr:TnsA-like heteromeric transposase endonuclease subunit [Nonomuraea aurantiaca]MCA2220177.1 TnsA-like heteromeric transposase endonuclease subunit [Nonomuraea aurantiaca]